MTRTQLEVLEDTVTMLRAQLQGSQADLTKMTQNRNELRKELDALEDIRTAHYQIFAAVETMQESLSALSRTCPSLIPVAT